MEEELEKLRSRLTDIEKESQETSLKQEERLRAIQSKKDVEVRILEKERKLLKHRKAAQQALQQIVKGISAITPPAGVGRPRFDLISEEGEEEEEDEPRKMSLVSYSSSSSMGSLCEPKTLKLSVSEPSIAIESSGIHEPRVMKTSTSSLSVSSAAVCAANQRKRGEHSGDSGTDSSSCSNSPEVPRHEFNLAEEIVKCLPSTDEYGVVSRDKSKSFDSGIMDEVDVNSNKTLSVTTNGHLEEESALSSDAPQSTQPLEGRKPIRTEISEDVLRDIEVRQLFLLDSPDTMKISLAHFALTINLIF